MIPSILAAVSFEIFRSEKIMLMITVFFDCVRQQRIHMYTTSWEN